MQDIERSTLAEQNREIIALLRAIKAQGEPVTTVDQAERMLTPVEFRQLQLAAVKDHSFAELVTALAENRGFASVDDMSVHDDKLARARAKRTTTVDILGSLKANNANVNYAKASAVLEDSFLRHVGKKGDLK